VGFSAPWVELRLFNTAALACSRSGKRRIDLAQISIATKESLSAAFTSFDQDPELFKVVDDKIRT
jgi:hypothetical protein